MKRAAMMSVAVTTAFYMLCGCMGYAAFGDDAPGFYSPYWLLDVANVVYLVGAYQVSCQPIFAFVEKWASRRCPESGFVTKEYAIRLLPGASSPSSSSSKGSYSLNLFRLVWRTAFVVLTTVVSMLLPFFNDVVGLLGVVGFWPLTVYFPVEMYVNQKKIPRWSAKCVALQVLSFSCLLISVAAAAGSVAGVVQDMKVYRPFKSEY